MSSEPRNTTQLKQDEPDDVPAANSRAERHVVAPPDRDDPLFFVAGRGPDDTYAVVLTKEGVQTFETALGLARDLSGGSGLSPSSTIADVMERTALRNELSDVMLQSKTTQVHALRLGLLRRRLRGSDEPSAREKLLGHGGRSLIVCLFLVWTLVQFATSVADVASIPGIVAGIPADLMQFHPLSALSDTGARLTDAGLHGLYGTIGLVLTCVAAMVVKPFARIYRRDQVLVGERPALRLAATWLDRFDRPSRPPEPMRLAEKDRHK